MSSKIISVCTLKEERINLGKSDVLCKLLNVTKPRAQFFSYIIGEFLTSNSKINFKQLASRSDKTEQYFHRNFSNPFDFSKFNALLISQYLSSKLVLALTTIHVPKTGEKTYGSDLFCTKKIGSPINGLAFTTLSVVELENEAALHLEALQLPTRAHLNKWGLSERDLSLSLIGQVMKKYSWMGSYLNVDLHHFCRDFSNEIHKRGLYLIGSLETYSDFWYPSIASTSVKKGRPYKYAGKINFQELSPDYFKRVLETDQYYVDHAVVYNKNLSRKVAIIVCREKDSNEQPIGMIYSTDTEVDPFVLMKYYKIPEIVKSLHEDAKNHAGLCDCQGRVKEIIRYHINASLTAVNIARSERWLSKPPESRGQFSMLESKKYYQKKMIVEKKSIIYFKCKHHRTKTDMHHSKMVAFPLEKSNAPSNYNMTNPNSCIEEYNDSCY